VVPGRRCFPGLGGGGRGVAGALQQTLSQLGLELNLRKKTVWGPSLVPASSPLAAGTRLHLEEGTEVLGVPIHIPLCHSPVGTHLRTLKGKFSRTCAAVAALADTQCAHALMRSSLGPAKVQYAIRTLPIRDTAVFAADITATQRATWGTVVGGPTSDAAWVQTTLPVRAEAAGSPAQPMWRRWRDWHGSCSSLPGRSPCWGVTGNWSCPWPPRRDSLTPSMRACPQPWNHYIKLDSDQQV